MDMGGRRAEIPLALEQDLSYTFMSAVWARLPHTANFKCEAMSIVNFPPSAPPMPIHCEECEGARFFVYEDQSFICATCGYQYDWGPGTNGNGHEQPELKFDADPDLIAIVKEGDKP